MKIGIFDSGIGGLSVLQEAYHQLPDQEFLFYADTEHVPYGLKSPEQIIGYAKDITDFLLDKGAGAIVVACNTATSVAIKSLRSTYDIPIIGMPLDISKGFINMQYGEGNSLFIDDCANNLFGTNADYKIQFREYNDGQNDKRKWISDWTANGRSGYVMYHW
jgi:hypothetical protein